MFVRFAFTLGVVVLFLVPAACTPPAPEADKRPQEAAPPDREPYALPGWSARDEQGRLVRLWLEGPDDATLRQVVENSPHLTLLGLHDCRASREGLLSLRGLKHLEELEFRDRWPTREFVDLIHLAKIGQIERLSLRPGDFALHCENRSEQGDVLAIRLYKPDDAMLARVFVEFPRLTSFIIMDGKYTEDAFRTIENLKHFEELILIHRHPQFTGKSLADVAKVPALKRLGLNGTSIGDDDLVHLGRHPQLVELNIGNAKVSDLGMEYIARSCPDLEELDVKCLPITCRSGRAIARLKKLQKLHIGYTSIGEDGLAALATLPDLRQVSLPEITTDRGMAEVGKMKSLRTLFIYYPKITDAGTAHLAGLANLEWLRLHCHDELTDECLVHLGRVKSLKTLELSSNNIEGHGLIHLNGLPLLGSLDIDGYGLRAEHFSKIAGHKSLRCLCIGHTSFVTPEDIEVLKQFKSLRALEAALNLEQVDDLKQALPNCSIYSE